LLLILTGGLAGCGVGQGDVAGTADLSAALAAGRNSAGVAESAHVTGAIDRTGSFFQPLGTNPRTCETCHSPSQGWTITAEATRRLFWQTQGLAPLFLPHDEGARPDGDLSTLLARLTDFGPTLLARGLTRFGRTVAATADFTVVSVVDPSGFSTPAAFINFRRPTSSANEAKTSSVTSTAGPGEVRTALTNLVGGAANFHLQRNPATPVPADVASAQVDFQLGLFFAQTIDNEAGPLDEDGAMGGPQALMVQPFHIGINDIQGNDPEGQPFTSKVFNLFDAWAIYDREPDHGHDHDHGDGHGRHCLQAGSGHDRRVAAARAAIYRGQEIFNNRTFNITGVHGINDLLGQPTVQGSCSTCHNAPNVGGHSVVRFFDTGTADEGNCLSSVYPVVTLQNKTTGAIRKVCDPGRAGAGFPPTGHWVDVGAFRAPPLRGLAGRSPYFHDGQAADIMALIRFYEHRFNFYLGDQGETDLGAFLEAL
jgi:hypothetical protein